MRTFVHQIESKLFKLVHWFCTSIFQLTEITMFFAKKQEGFLNSSMRGFLT
jgi:hypothetical protein